jgi:hypothetical protein
MGVEIDAPVVVGRGRKIGATDDLAAGNVQ